MCPARTPEHKRPHPDVSRTNLTTIQSMLVMIRRGKPGNAATINDYLFGYCWALQHSGLIDRFQEGVIAELSGAALRYTGQPGFTTTAQQGSQPCREPI